MKPPASQLSHGYLLPYAVRPVNRGIGAWYYAVGTQNLRISDFVVSSVERFRIAEWQDQRSEIRDQWRQGEVFRCMGGELRHPSQRVARVHPFAFTFAGGTR